MRTLRTVALVLWAVVLSWLLGACSTTRPPKVDVQVEKLPVAVSCVKEVPAKPSFPMDNPDAKTWPLYKKGVTALLEIEAHRNYERELEAVVRGCL